MPGVTNPDPRTNGKTFTIYVCTSCGEHSPVANGDGDYCGKCPGRVAPVLVMAVDFEPIEWIGPSDVDDRG